LNAVREKSNNLSLKITADFTTETLKLESNGVKYFEDRKKIILALKKFYPIKPSFKIEEGGGLAE
jgi:hypothetical protein